MTTFCMRHTVDIKRISVQICEICGRIFRQRRHLSRINFVLPSGRGGTPTDLTDLHRFFCALRGVFLSVGVSNVPKARPYWSALRIWNVLRQQKNLCKSVRSVGD